MTNAAKRAARTFVQGFVGVLVLLAVPQLRRIIDGAMDGEVVGVDLAMWQTIALAGVAGGVIALLSWAQNELEDRGKVKPIMKDGIQSGTTNPDA